MFNVKSRSENIIKTFLGFGLTYVINTIMQFLYRSFFIRILSKEYLGIEGLFGNIIQVLSFAELGIGTVIAYHLYEPVRKRDIYKVAGLLQLYKKIYLFIAIFIAIVGSIISNFLPLFIKDINEVPRDISLTKIYFLFVFQCISSYLFSYKQTLLSADQRAYGLAIYLCIKNSLQSMIKIIVLYFTRDYTIMLVCAVVFGITADIIMNYIIGKYYKDVMKVKVKTDLNLLKKIMVDVKAMLFHRIGGTILNSTDNLVMSSYIGVGTVGIYSNYSMLISSVQNAIYQIMGNFNGSIGNAHIMLSLEQKYKTYRLLQQINYYIANIAVVTMFILLNAFIEWWQGGDMMLSNITVIVILINLYLNITRVINSSYINACGLFDKDLPRPVIEAVANLFISIILVQEIGITGIIVGTIISHLLTVWWREPYLLYYYEFKVPLKKHWMTYIKYLLLTVIECAIIYVFSLYSNATLGSLLIKGVSTVPLCILIIVLVDLKNNELYCIIQILKSKILKKNK